MLQKGKQGIAVKKNVRLLRHLRVLLSRLLQHRQYRLLLRLRVPRSITSSRRNQPVNPRHKISRIRRIMHRRARHTYIHRTGRSIRIQIKNRILRLIAESAQNAPPARVQRDRAVDVRRRAIAIESKLPRHFPVADDLQMIHRHNRRHLGRKFHFLLSCPVVLPRQSPARPARTAAAAHSSQTSAPP